MATYSKQLQYKSTSVEAGGITETSGWSDILTVPSGEIWEVFIRQLKNQNHYSGSTNYLTYFGFLFAGGMRVTYGDVTLGGNTYVYWGIASSTPTSDAYIIENPIWLAAGDKFQQYKTLASLGTDAEYDLLIKKYTA